MKVDATMILGVVLLLLVLTYIVDPTFFGLFGKSGEGYADTTTGEKTAPSDVSGEQQKKAELANPHAETSSSSSATGSVEHFESGPADFGSARAPAGCYPRDQLTASELLPRDGSSVWAQQNPMGPGSLKGKNFLSAGALIGINTVGQSMKNANLQLRSEPPCPQTPVSIFNISTIEPDMNRRPLEIN